MPRFLPSEILDLIVNHLHDEATALRACCVVNKSWIPRAREHLFVHVEFQAQKAHIERWKKTFPDPSKSPARHTRSLSILGLPIVTAAGTGVGGWIRTFDKVVHLRLECLGWNDQQASLVPFYGFSPTIRSLHLTSTVFEGFGLICSFPLLEDLELVLLTTSSTAEWVPPPTSPKFTGSLDMRAVGGLCFATRRLLDLPGGLRFKKITVACLNGDFESTTELVSRCSDTLVYLNISYHALSAITATPLDLSAATKLKRLVFRSAQPSVQWINTALRTVNSKDLQWIVLWPGITTFVNTIGETVHREWQELDHLLVQFWTSHSIRPLAIYDPVEGRKDMRDHAPSLLPELARRGLVDLVEILPPLKTIVW